MNQLIRFLWDAGLTQAVYNSFLALCFAGWFIYNFWSGKRYGLPGWKRITVSVVIWPLAYGLLYVLYWIESRFSQWGSHNIVRGFIYFPILAVILGKLIHIRGRTIVDYIAPGVSLCQGIAHIGCSFAGCCHGYEASFGIWNPVRQTYMVPNQALEALAALLTFAVCAIYARRKQYNSDGRVYPLFLILFGVTRFFLEFLRDNEKVLGSVSILALHAALMVIVGAAWLLVLRRTGRRNEE